MFFTERALGEIHVVQTNQPVAPADQALAPVAAARELVAARFHTDASKVYVLSVTPEEWPDSCLGMPESGEVCAQVVTRGFEIRLAPEASTASLTYRSDEATNVRFDKLEAVSGKSDLFATVDSFQGSECGLLGIAVDPEFETNHYVYVYVTQPVPGENVGTPRVIRFTDVDGKGSEPTVIVGDLPTTNPDVCGHVSGNVHFGPDGYLYLSVGNFEEPDTAADLSQPTGKILRVNKADGSAATGNPFANNPTADKRVFAYGFRNPFDFAFSPETGKLYAPDNGPGNCDELNIVEPGADYGVPRSLPAAAVPSCLGLGGVDPIYLFALAGKKPEDFPSNVAPAGVAFLAGDRYPGFGAGLLVCEYMPQELHLLTFSGPNQDHVVNDKTVTSGCGYNVEVNDGWIYFSNSHGIFQLPPQAP
jgi:glucose/arabinose dehydrogenase